MSLRAILSGSRVKKRAVAPAAKKPAARASPSALARKPASRTSKAAVRGGDSIGNSKDGEEEEGDDDGDDYKLDDTGLLASLAADLSLRDVVQALRYARGNMFEPLPQQVQQTAGADDDGGANETRRGARAGAGGGFVGNSTRVAELLNMRRRMPALATTAHIAALLPNATATERETVALVRAGVLRKVVQPQWRRGFASLGGGGGSRGGGGTGDGNAAKNHASPSKTSDAHFVRRALAIGSESLGEVLVETAELQRLATAGAPAAALSEATRTAFVSWLAGEAATLAPPEDAKAFTVNGRPAPQLTVPMVDELVRAGFLVGHGAATGLLGSSLGSGHHSASSSRSSSARAVKSVGGSRGANSDTGDVYARPEDRTTLLSLETVAKAASGSFDAVGGVGAVYAAGGGGARGRGGGSGQPGQRGPASTEDLVLAVPGHGTFVKLVSGALAHLVGILSRTPYRETLETTLRQRWDASGSVAKATAGRRGGFRRVPLSRSRKWKDFGGLAFDWVLAEALGAGLVELFDTGSVGRGVRLLA